MRCSLLFEGMGVDLRASGGRDIDGEEAWEELGLRAMMRAFLNI